MEENFAFEPTELRLTRSCDRAALEPFSGEVVVMAIEAGDSRVVQYQREGHHLRVIRVTRAGTRWLLVENNTVDCRESVGEANTNDLAGSTALECSTRRR